ncbi:MAG: DUF1648 domain-containing protein [Candidatus Aenigmarchaeota archaeon]|nr:DUF1648 domain-containing protein [Candidatus Aenigmarchaeota archaeon]MBU5689270.1 DUF1648 domain-containing protein [Candidatus Aenigmarchaeota archaeon]
MNYKLIIIFVITSFIISLYFYPQMPDMMASHWNIEGNVDGYMKKQFALFLFPVLFLVLGFLFIFIPKIDPLKNNIKKFSRYYEGFIIIFFLVMYVFYFQMILWNINIKIKPNEIFPFVFFLLFYYISLLLEKTKQNWFIGIKTPWTLSDKKVWEKTHKIGSILFKISALIALIGIFFEKYSIFFVIIPPIFVIIYTFFYSYFEYKKSKRR